MDDFEVNYAGKEHANHLISDIRVFYPVAEYCTGILHFDITLKWDYQKQTVDSSVSVYEAESLHKYKTNHNSGHNIHHINGSDPAMGKYKKCHAKRTHHPYYQNRRKPTPK